MIYFLSLRWQLVDWIAVASTGVVPWFQISSVLSTKSNCGGVLNRFVFWVEPATGTDEIVLPGMLNRERE